MSTTNIPAWHSTCSLREDVRAGTLTLAEFAADLYGVRTGEAPEVYCDPAQFFARTFPTHAMKELVRDVLQRLAGTGGNPVLRLQVAYGGGKTHSLITLLHLAEHGASLSNQTTVREFLNFAGVQSVPAARVALLPFDKFDIHDGLTVIGPNGVPRKVMTPWGALAYQLAGDAGFARVKAHEEGWDTPAQPILEEILRAPQAEGKGALILIDEAVIYGRAAVRQDQSRLGTFKDFFQLLTQAVAQVNNSCLVATLIASENEALDQNGTMVLRALSDVFGRLQQTWEPVGRDDIAEIMRRRLFEKVPTDAERRPIIDTILAAYQSSSKLRQAQKDQGAYDRLLRSYPFHPDLIEAFYEKWTELPKFQRTRGALRILAQALQQSAESDPSPLIGLGAFLSPDPTTISRAVSELISICSEGHDQWTPKLSGELERAREVQTKLPSLIQREVEQAVLGAFLHSQPPGRRAEDADLYALLIHPGVDNAALETGLNDWRTLSWFLSEDTKGWQLTTTHNLTHIHVQAMRDLEKREPKINQELRNQIDKVRDLAATDKDGADRGVMVHRLPTGPGYVDDNTDLHYIVLGPECAVDPAQPVPSSVSSYFTTTSGPQNPRTYRNAIVALAPDASRLAALRRNVVEFVAWTEIESTDLKKQLSDAQKLVLAKRTKDAEDNLPSGVRATYGLVLDLGEDGNVRVQTLKSADSLGVADSRPFTRIKAMLVAEERLVVGDLLPELLLPGSYYDIWGPTDTSKRATDLLAAFAQFPRLPRFLSAQVFRNALARGCENGDLALRLARPDGTARYLWRVRPTIEDLIRTDLEVIPAANAELTEIDPALSAPLALPGLWPNPTDPISIKSLRSYFDGTNQPKSDENAIDECVRQAVARGHISLRIGNRSYFKETPPVDVLIDDAELLPPPPSITADDLMPTALPAAWAKPKTTVADIGDALSASRGYPAPWTLLSQAVTSAIQIGKLEVEEGKWPVAADAANSVAIRIKEALVLTPPPQPRTRVAEAEISALELQKLGDKVGDLKGAAPTVKLSFKLLLTVEGQIGEETVAAINNVLSTVSSKLKLDG